MSCSSHPTNLFNWWLVSTPLKNMKVSWDYYSQSMESHKIQVPNHHPTDHFGWIPQLRHIPGAVSILGMLQNESDIPNISFFFQPFFIQADGIDIDITRCSQFITLFNACCLTDLGFADPENPKKTFARSWGCQPRRVARDHRRARLHPPWKASGAVRGAANSFFSKSKQSKLKTSETLW